MGNIFCLKISVIKFRILGILTALETKDKVKSFVLSLLSLINLLFSTNGIFHLILICQTGMVL